MVIHCPRAIVERRDESEVTVQFEWSLEDIVAKIDEMAPAPKARGPYKKRPALYGGVGSGSTTGECTVQHRNDVWFKSHLLPTKIQTETLPLTDRHA